MSLFYYINLVKKIDSPKLLECLIIWNGVSTFVLYPIQHWVVLPLFTFDSYISKT